MGKKEVKTNAMRILDRKKISYEYQTYECDEFTDGIETADKLNLPHEQVYKTIVTTGKASFKGVNTAYRLCAWWMHFDRNEKAFSDGH